MGQRTAAERGMGNLFIVMHQCSFIMLAFGVRSGEIMSVRGPLDKILDEPVGANDLKPLEIVPEDTSRIFVAEALGGTKEDAIRDIQVDNQPSALIPHVTTGGSITGWPRGIATREDCQTARGYVLKRWIRRRA